MIFSKNKTHMPLNITRITDSLINASSTEVDYDTLLQLLYYVVITYDNNFETVAETVDNNAEILDSVRLVMVIMFVLLLVLTIIAYILICALCTEKRRHVEPSKGYTTIPEYNSIPMRPTQQ